MKDKVAWGVVGSCGIARRRTIPEGIVPAANAKLVGLCDCNQCSGESGLYESI